MPDVPSTVVPGHRDFVLLDKIRTEIIARAKGVGRLKAEFPVMICNAIDFVLDPVRTGRTLIKQLDNVEKTFIGLKVEHFVRDFLDVPKGLRDLVIDGVDVDIKHTVGSTWTIPPETFLRNELCILIVTDEASASCSLGLFVARQEYLNAPNRDGKRSVSKRAFENILWLIEDAEFAESHWSGINMIRFRELRKIRGGSKRAAQFFRETLRQRVHRTVIRALLFDQLDYMKRVRGNGGARDILRREAIAILSGAYDAELLKKMGLAQLQADEFIAVKPANAEEEQQLRETGVIN